MTTRQPLSHFSPIFANKPWQQENEYVCYAINHHHRRVERSLKGLRQWGRRRGIYNWPVELALNRDLETDAAKIYRKLLEPDELSSRQKLTWAQFLLSQVVRTPSFLRYEAAVRKRFKIGTEPPHDRVGCQECCDLTCITQRDWCLLLAHRDDHFIRSDNPVLLSGFVERAATSLYYPLSPRLCFVACSMPAGWRPSSSAPTPRFLARRLSKGDAFLINFHLMRAADNSIIVHPAHDGRIVETMARKALGRYPQPPFELHSPAEEHLPKAYESIRIIMSAVDGRLYPRWLPFELETLHLSSLAK